MYMYKHMCVHTCIVEIQCHVFVEVCDLIHHLPVMKRDVLTENIILHVHVHVHGCCHKSIILTYMYAHVLVVLVNTVIGLWISAPNKPAALGEIRPDQTTRRQGVCRSPEKPWSGGI